MTRDFDTVFSSALRVHLEHLVEPGSGTSTATARSWRTLVQQGLIAGAVLALVLAGTIGVLQIATARTEPSAPAPSNLPTALPFIRGRVHSGDVVVAKARSGTASVTGLLPASTRLLKMDLNCQGPGIVLVRFSNGQSASFTHPVGRPTPGHPLDFNIGCDPKGPTTAEIGLSLDAGKSTDPLRYTVSVERGPTVWSLLFIKTNSPDD